MRLTWAKPCGLVPTNLASQAWNSILAWYTDHPVGGLCHPGTCISQRAFPTIVDGGKPEPMSLHRSPGLWSATLAGASTARCWEMWGG